MFLYVVCAKKDTTNFVVYLWKKLERFLTNAYHVCHDILSGFVHFISQGLIRRYFLVQFMSTAVGQCDFLWDIAVLINDNSKHIGP
jgi:hypothetical protein